MWQRIFSAKTTNYTLSAAAQKREIVVVIAHPDSWRQRSERAIIEPVRGGFFEQRRVHAGPIPAQHEDTALDQRVDARRDNCALVKSD